MPAPLSNDLRLRIIDAWERKEGTWAELAERFGVGVATVDRLVARYRRTGSVAPTEQKNGPDPKLGDAELVIVRELLESEPDLTRPELREELAEKTGTVVSVATIGRVVRERLGWTRKKRPSSRRSATVPRSPALAKHSSNGCDTSQRIASCSSTRADRTSR